jgi:hypothetical protein
VLPLPLLSINHPKLTFLNWYFPILVSKDLHSCLNLFWIFKVVVIAKAFHYGRFQAICWSSLTTDGFSVVADFTILFRSKQLVIRTNYSRISQTRDNIARQQIKLLLSS